MSQFMDFFSYKERNDIRTEFTKNILQDSKMVSCETGGPESTELEA